MRSVRVRVWSFAGLSLAIAGMMLVIQPGQERLSAGSSSTVIAPDLSAVCSDTELQDAIGTFTAIINKDLKTKATFSRVRANLKNISNTIALLANAGVGRMKGDDAKKMAALRDAALALAKACSKAGKFEDAEGPAKIIKSYPAKIEPAAEAKQLPWKEVCSLHDMMSIVNKFDGDVGTAVKAGKDVFKKGARESSHKSIVNAVIAVPLTVTAKKRIGKNGAMNGAPSKQPLPGIQQRRSDFSGQSP